MNLIDLLIIYFTGGAPLAVYYFLQNRHGSKDGQFWLKNLLVLLFWMPYGIFLLLRKESRRCFLKLNFLNATFVKNSDEEKISVLQKQIENLLRQSDSEISIFDFRETAERYAGLTIAAENKGNDDSEHEIFRVAKNDNTELGTICLYRRNRNKLIRHQIEARQDFLNFVGKLADSISDTKSLQNSAVEIVEILKDDTARKILAKMFAENMQTGKTARVEYSETDLWKPQERKPLRTDTISTRL